MSFLSRVVIALPAAFAVAPLAAVQAPADAATLALVERAVARRMTDQADGRLARWSAQARGTVLFLSQVGGDRAVPRLVKADELVVEVYWEAPGRSKQEIVAWRDKAWLPTDIRYHRDHLGIVSNDFGPLIRIGEGDEVRDVPHPLSAPGRGQYLFTLVDSIAIRTADREVRVHTIQVRPLDPARPAVIGTLYLDVATAALVRFRFSFTRAAYFEDALEDITVVLENALHGAGVWLPWRQEIEIRRRAGVLDFPARGIIRARWELGDFLLGQEAAPRSWLGPPIAGLQAPGGPDRYWLGPLDEQVAPDIAAATGRDLEHLRAEIRRMAGRRLAAHGPPLRLAAGRLSDLLRVNRVEGTRLGLGSSFRLPEPVGGRLEGWAGIATATARISGRARLTVPVGNGVRVSAGLGREVIDGAGGLPVSPMLNSLLAQEAGVDRGDWLERSGAELGATIELGHALAFTVTGRLWNDRALEVASTPSRGEYRPNPALGTAPYRTIELAVARERVAGSRHQADWRLAAEWGNAGSAYFRASGGAGMTATLGGFEVSLDGSGGWASGAVPIGRTWAIGGWGTLPGAPYRAWGGRWFGLGRIELLAEVPVPAIALGSLATTGASWHIGPFLAAGAAGGQAGAADPAGPSWAASEGIRPSLGVALEGLWRLLRIEVGRGLRGGGWGASVDIATLWWAIL